MLLTRSFTYTQMQILSLKDAATNTIFSQGRYNLAQRCFEDVRCTPEPSSLEMAPGDTPPCACLAGQALGLLRGWAHWNLGDDGPRPSS